MDRIKGDSSTHFQLFAGREYESQIDFTNDQDWFYIYLVPGIRYELTLRALNPAPLPDPLVTVLEEDETVLYSGKQNDKGNLSRVQFVAPYENRLFLAARDGANGIGNYRIGVKALDDDFANNVKGAGKLEFTDGVARASAQIEQLNDQDWFTVNLKAGTWYEIESNSPQTAAFFIRGPGRQKSSSLDTHDRYFAEKSGRYHVVARKNRWGFKLGDYEIVVREGELPYLSATRGQTTSAVSVQGVTNHNEFPINYYHIYSDDRLGFGVTTYQFQEKPAGRIYRASKSNLWRWRVLNDSQKNSNLYVRGLTSLTDDGFVTPWRKINIATSNSGSLLSGSRWRPVNGGPREIQFSFANSLPRYFEGDSRFNNFAPLSEAQRESVREALRRWDLFEISLKFVEVAPTPNNDNAEIMIFSADQNAPVTGFRPAPFGGSDLVLDRNHDVLSDLRLGSRGFFELLRGIGKSLGLKASNEFSRNESVLGRYVDNETFNSIYPTSPGPMDIDALTDTFDRFRYKKNTELNKGDSSYLFKENIADTISDFGGTDGIDGSGTQKVQIDLTPGASSYQWTGSQKTSVITIGFDSVIENALGGTANDRLLGNGWNNSLEGADGNDYLEGRVGNDILRGGRGSDEYYYGLGDDNDVILDEGGPRDKLVIHGLFSFNDLTDDLSFQKINGGKDLLINLSLDNDDQNRQGSIRIRNMHRRRYQVETLSISNPQREFGDVSLRNLFQQATTEVQRFRFTKEDDVFGRLVAPA